MEQEMLYPYVSVEALLKIRSGEESYVRIDISGMGNPVPHVTLPREVSGDKAILVKYGFLNAYYELYGEYLDREKERWAFSDNSSHPELFRRSMANASIIVFRNPEFMYRLGEMITQLSESHGVDIQIFWKGEILLRAFEYAPQFEIPAPNCRECAFCGKRFVPIGRNAKTQVFCTPEEREKARYRRAYLRRKKRQGTLSESESK